jgi:hypothetical protein
MYVDLGCSGVTDEGDTGGVCDAVKTVDAIADGGDFGEPGAVEGVDFLDVGDVTFTLSPGNCGPVCIDNCP